VLDFKNIDHSIARGLSKNRAQWLPYTKLPASVKVDIEQCIVHDVQRMWSLRYPVVVKNNEREFCNLVALFFKKHYMSVATNRTAGHYRVLFGKKASQQDFIKIYTEVASVSLNQAPEDNESEQGMLPLIVTSRADCILL
jgi:hypothetical protein